MICSVAKPKASWAISDAVSPAKSTIEPKEPKIPPPPPRFVPCVILPKPKASAAAFAPWDIALPNPPSSVIILLLSPLSLSRFW